MEFLDAQLMAANDAALAQAWREKYDEDVPATGRPGRKTDAPRTERVAVLLTPDELGLLDEAAPSDVAAGNRYPDMGHVNR